VHKSTLAITDFYMPKKSSVIKPDKVNIKKQTFDTCSFGAGNMEHKYGYLGVMFLILVKQRPAI
jgi:hypothetical protein